MKVVIFQLSATSSGENLTLRKKQNIRFFLTLRDLLACQVSSKSEIFWTLQLWITSFMRIKTCFEITEFFRKNLVIHIEYEFKLSENFFLITLV